MRDKGIGVNMIVFLTERGRVGLEFSDYGLLSFKLPGDITENTPLTSVPDHARPLVDKIIAYYRNQAVDFSDVVLDMRGTTEFSRLVYNSLRTRVLYGQRLSYSQLAELCGRAKAYRAVGTALAKNPWPLIVPCHRVLGSGGSLGGFSGAGGIVQKKAMLDMESAILSV